MLSKIKNCFHKPTFDMSLYKQKMSLLKNTKSIEKMGFWWCYFRIHLFFQLLKRLHTSKPPPMTIYLSIKK